MIGSVRLCATNNDIYLVTKKETESNYRVYWLRVGYTSDDIADIMSDEEIYKINPRLVKKIDPYSFLKLIYGAYKEKIQ